MLHRILLGVGGSPVIADAVAPGVRVPYTLDRLSKGNQVSRVKEVTSAVKD